MLEAMLPKRRILEIYLNVIEWGNGVFGAEAAARQYFGVSAAQLSAEQAARLAAMAPNPRVLRAQPAGSRPYLDGRIGDHPRADAVGRAAAERREAPCGAGGVRRTAR